MSRIFERLCYPIVAFLLVASFAGRGGPISIPVVKSAFASDSTESLPYLIDRSVLSEESLDIAYKGGLPGKALAHLQPWGKSSLQIAQAVGNAPIVLSGSTGSEPAGFTAKGLSHATRLISFTLDHLIKSSNSQVSFSFVVSDGRKDYTITLVSGPLSVSGWKGSTYYDRIVPGSTITYDMDKIFGVQGISLSVEQFSIVVQKNTDLRAEFRASVISPLQYQGAMRYADSVVYDGIVIHDLQVVRSLVVRFDSPPADYTIVDNGWQSVNYDGSRGTLTATAPLQTSVSESLPRIDIGGSLMHPGAKDVLFASIIGVAAAGLAIFPSRELRRKVA